MYHAYYNILSQLKRSSSEFAIARAAGPGQFPISFYYGGPSR